MSKKSKADKKKDKSNEKKAARMDTRRPKQKGKVKKQEQSSLLYGAVEMERKSLGDRKVSQFAQKEAVRMKELKARQLIVKQAVNTGVDPKILARVIKSQELRKAGKAFVQVIKN